MKLALLFKVIVINLLHQEIYRRLNKFIVKIKEFAPLKINTDLKEGYIMEYRIEEKSFKVVGISRKLKYENEYEKYKIMARV